MSDEKISTASDTADAVKVSVVIPVYNVEKYLEEAVDSIINQSLRDIEIICVNDGSTDKSGEILDSYAAKDTRIRVIHQENKGLGATRNVALKEALGKYVYFFDSDDILESDALRFLYETAEKDELDVVLFEGVSFYESPELEERFPNYKVCYHRKAQYPDVLSGEEMFVALTENWDFIVSVCMKLHRTSYLKEKNIYFPEKIYYEDEIFSVKSVVLAEKARVVENAFYHRRVRDNSIITDPGKLFMRYASYHETACLLVDMIAGGGLQQNTVRALAFRVYCFFENAEKYYKLFDDEMRERARTDPAVRPFEYSFLASVFELYKPYFFELKRNRRNEAEIVQLKDKIRLLNNEYSAQQRENEKEIVKLKNESERLREAISVRDEKLNEHILKIRQLRETYVNLTEEKKARNEEIKGLKDDKREQLKEINSLKAALAEEKEKNSSLTKSNNAYKKRLKAIDEGAIVVRMDKRLVRILKGIKRRIKRLLGR